jgi:predicted ATPase/class 3 adenylate cyclase
MGVAASTLPDGTVTFLFTDLEGSTRLLRSQGSAYAGLLERHRAILSGAASEGTVFGSAGDALFVAFNDAAAALRAARYAQQSLANEDWPADAALSVRMGVHTGLPEIHAGDYVGIDVHRVARICSAAHGGQVVVSNATRAIVAQTGLKDVELMLLGEYRLKDFDAAEPLYQLIGPGLPLQFPPLRTARSQILALPRESSSFVGRDDEQTLLLAAIADHRVVTITGPGGVGKSKLALRTAWHAAPRFDGIVAFVSLARVDAVNNVPSAIATAIGQDGALSTWDEVMHAFGDQRCLFLIDNAEHLPGLPPHLDAWSRASEQVHLLITSRSPIAVPGERILPLEPLPGGDATQLLIDRIQERQPTFKPTPAQAQTLENIVARLDGLPLAIELAAARVRVLPPAALLSRLDQQMDVLGTSGRGDDRQRSMRQTIQWSYDLLPAEPAAVFRRLAVFAAPATLPAVAAVAQCDDLDALDALEHLVDASLVRLGGSDDQPRYWMLEPIKQFAHEQLMLSAEGTTAAHDMYAWLLAQARLCYPTVGDMLQTLRNDVENINRVLTNLADAGDSSKVMELVELLLDGIILPLGLFVRFQPLIEQALSHPAADEPSRARSALLRTLFVDNLKRAELSEAAYQLASAFGDDRLAAHALIMLLGDYLATNDTARLEDALSRARAIDREGMRLEWGIVAAESRLRFDHEGWDASYAGAIVARVRRSADQLDTIAMLNSLAWTALVYGDADFALEPAEEAAQRADDLGLLWYAQVMWHTAAVAALALDHPETARRHLEAAAANMVSCNSGSEANLAILLATAAVLAAHEDRTGAQHLLQSLPLDVVRADFDCRWDICEPYLRDLPTIDSTDPDFASDSIAGFTLERLEKLPERRRAP